MHQKNIPSTPPRNLPFSALIQLLFGGFSNQFGWMFFGFGMIFLIVFGARADLSQALFAMNEVETVSGIIIGIKETNSSENDIPIYAYTYTFKLDHGEKSYKDVSYTTDLLYEIEQGIVVEYLAKNPALSRIKGARRAEFSPWVLFFISIFPLIGLIFIISGLARGIKALYLLSRGIGGEAKLKSKKPTNTSINKQRVYKLIFDFVTEDGRHFDVASKTHENYLLEDDARERLLYDPSNPANAVMLDNLPGSPDFDEVGQIKPFPVRSTILALMPPVLAIVINLAAWMLFT